MIPNPWVAIVLVLASFRLTRLASYDAFPPVARLRAWIIGEHETTSGSQNDRMGLTAAPPTITVTYRRPVLAELFHCVFCVGFWVALAVYGCWLAAGHPGAVDGKSWAVYGAAPLALNAAAALVARWLDP